MRVLVCGGRDFDDHMLLVKTLLEYQTEKPITCIIHGNARGADTLADRFADLTGIPKEVYPADWDKYNKAAGPIRNAQMITEGKPDLVIAFPGGKGTANMIKQAKDAGIPVKEIKHEH